MRTKRSLFHYLFFFPVPATVTTDVLTSSTELITEEGLEVISNTISSPLSEQHYTRYIKGLKMNNHIKDNSKFN